MKKRFYLLVIILLMFAFASPLKAFDLQKKTLINDLEIKESPSSLLKIQPIPEDDTEIGVVATSTTTTGDEEGAGSDETDEGREGASGNDYINSGGFTKPNEETGVKKNEEGISGEEEGGELSETKLQLQTEDGNPVLVEEKNEVLEIDFSQTDRGLELLVCNLDGGCSGDLGQVHWASEATVQASQMERDFKFTIEDENYSQGLLQISYLPFSENENTPIIFSQGVSEGYFDIDFSKIYTSGETLENINALLGQGFQISIASEETEEESAVSNKLSLWSRIVNSIKQVFAWPFKFFNNSHNNVQLVRPQISAKPNLHNFTYKTFYVRVLPVKNGQIVGLPSNEIKIVKVDDEEADIEIYTPAKLFDVEIANFKPIRGAETCNGAVILDTDWEEVRGGVIVHHKAGDRLCPAPYKGVGEQAWYESFWDFVKSGVAWVSEQYNNFKSAVLDKVAGAICGGDEACKTLVATGLNAGMVAMGIPPTLPNFDQLMDQGFDYLASELATQAGCYAPECKELIEKGLHEAIDSMKSTNPACKGEAEAHNLGYEPLCLPSNVKAHADPLSSLRNAEVTLRVSRNFEDGSSLMGAPYKLNFYNWAYNAGLIGNRITNIPPYGESVEITEAIEGQMFEGKSIIIPNLEKGQSIDIPINLIATEFWIPGHKEAMHGWSTVTVGDGWINYQYDDWWKLYYGGTLSMAVVIDGCPVNFGQSDCIVASDYMSVELPNTLNP